MMGLCSSCFGSNYLGQSPPQDSLAPPDAEKLISQQSSSASIPLPAGKNIIKAEHKQFGGKIGVPEESAGGDGDEDEEDADDDDDDDDDVEEEEKAESNNLDTGSNRNNLRHSSSDELDVANSCVGKARAGEPTDDSNPAAGLELDNVQVTLAGAATIIGVLEDVPESEQESIPHESENVSGQAEEEFPLLPGSPPIGRKELPPINSKPAVFGSPRCNIKSVEGNKKKFVINKVNSKSLLNTGPSSRTSSISGASKSSLPPSRVSSRPPSKPPSRSSSRAPSPESSQSSVSRVDKQQHRPIPRFSVIGVEGPPRKERPERSSREKSPGVSFAESEEVFDFQDRQYQTVHAGCEIPIKTSFRERTRSGRFYRERRKSVLGSRPSIIDWPMGKIAWLKDRQKSGSKNPVSKEDSVKGKAVGKEAEKELEKESAANDDLTPQTRPRSKSDRFSRPSKKQVVDVYKQAAFDWPLGQLGKIKQKYQKSKSTKRSKSDANLAEISSRNLKRRGSERHGKARKVAFEDEQAVPWWNYPMKLMKNATLSASTGNIKKKRSRHNTDPDSRTRGGLEPDTRRRASSLSTPHRASDVQVDPAHSAILFRDARGLPVSDPFLSSIDFRTVQKDETQILVKFFGFHRCYDLIPTSAKLVVFDTQLLVKKAFFALVYNGVRAAPLWDSIEQRFVGMLTITDFIRILQMNYKSPTLEMEELEEHKLSTWRKVLSDIKELIFIHPDASLYDAIKTLIHNKIHRLPVIDPSTGNVLYILTHKRILRFLFLYIGDLPQAKFLQQTILSLNIGTYTDVEVAFEETPIIEALHKFVFKRVSALPIVDKEGHLIDIYAKFDVINLAAEKTYSNLDISLKQANRHRNEWFEGVHKCTADETLYEIMERIVKAEVHRLVIVDEDNKVRGVVSLSDILNFLVLKPGGDDLREKRVASVYEEETATEQEEAPACPDSSPSSIVSSPRSQNSSDRSTVQSRLDETLPEPVETAETNNIDSPPQEESPGTDDPLVTSADTSPLEVLEDGLIGEKGKTCDETIEEAIEEMKKDFLVKSESTDSAIEVCKDTSDEPFSDEQKVEIKIVEPAAVITPVEEKCYLVEDPACKVIEDCDIDSSEKLSDLSNQQTGHKDISIQ